MNYLIDRRPMTGEWGVAIDDHTSDIYLYLFLNDSIVAKVLCSSVNNQKKITIEFISIWSLLLSKIQTLLTPTNPSSYFYLFYSEHKYVYLVYQTNESVAKFLALVDEDDGGKVEFIDECTNFFCLPAIDSQWISLNNLKKQIENHVNTR